MRELAGAFLSVPWAASLFGLEQLSRLVAGGPGAAIQVEAELYKAVKATEEGMSDVAWAIYRVGDSAQRAAVDALAELVTLRAPQRGALDQMVRDVADQTAESTETWLSDVGRGAALIQLKNSLEVFNLVKSVTHVLSIPKHDRFTLEPLVAQAYALGDFPDLWAIEGLGHDYADRFWDGDEPIAGILENEWARNVPRSSLTMLHAGVGLSFAQRLLKTVSPYDSDATVRNMLRQYITLCQANSLPGYDGAALESLGLVTRTWHPQMVTVTDENLAVLDPRAREFFWHGAGRALYFHPLYIVPGILSPWRAVDREPPDPIARANMRAGLAWATTIVNLRQPEVLVRLIATRGADLAQDDSFSWGLVSSLVMAQDITPHDRCIASFGEFDPSALPPGVRERWERLVRRPYLDAIHRAQPMLASRDLLGEVFRYHPYPGWLDALSPRTGPRPGEPAMVH